MACRVVTPDLPTRITASARVESARPSTNGKIGAESMTTNRKRCRSFCKTCCMVSEQISCPAFPFNVPAGKMERLGKPGTSSKAESRGRDCPKTSPNPWLVVRLNARASLPLRRSASIRHVLPCLAKAYDRFSATVVLPSPGKEDAISSACGGLPGHDSMMEPYKAWTASPSGEFGLSKKKVLVCNSSAPPELGRSPTMRFDHGRLASWRSDSPMTGITETLEFPIHRLMSSGERSLLSNSSQIKASATPPKI